MNLRGTLPVLILHALEHGPKHGYLIAMEIKNKSKGVLDYKEGTLYPALHDHERKGNVISYEEMESGRMRRYYRLTESGHAVLEKERAEWLKHAGAVSLILGEA